jgi:HSP20 family protein
MAVTRRSPTEGLHEELIHAWGELERLFARLGLPHENASPHDPWTPCVDVYEADGALTIVMEVPGLSPDSLRVSWSSGRLTVTGERRERRPAGAVAFLCMERPHGRFARTVALDVPVDARRAQARLSGGLLTVVLPRLDDRRGRETVIPVERQKP